VRFRVADGGDELMAQVWKRFDEIGKEFNSFAPDSEVSLFNNGTVDMRAVSSRFMDLLEMSKVLAVQTKGAFDPTIWPLKMLWRNAQKLGAAPTDDQIISKKNLVGFDKLVIARRNAIAQRRDSDTSFDTTSGPGFVKRLVNGMALDFGGIVKGYAVDLVAELLALNGATDWLIQCGGEISTHGKSPSGEPWQIGIQHPQKSDSVWGKLAASDDLHVSTSGNYEQPVKIGDKVYHHIIDPRTGRPVESQVLGVTVVLEKAKYPNAKADAYATALTVLPLEQAKALVENIPGLSALFIIQEKDGSVSEALVGRMKDCYSR